MPLVYINHVLLGALVAHCCSVLTAAPIHANFDMDDNSTTDVGIFLGASVSPCCLEDHLWGLLFVSVFSMTGYFLVVWILPRVFLMLKGSSLVLKDSLLVLKGSLLVFKGMVRSAPSVGASGKLGRTSFTAEELEAAAREADELEQTRMEEIANKAAENAVLLRNLKTILASLRQARLKGQAGDAMCRRQQDMLATQTELIVDQGNNALQMKAELQRTRDQLVSCEKDADKMVDEIELLRCNVEELQRQITRASADAKCSKEPVVQQQHRWEASVFFGLGYESVMDGDNVCPVPGKGHLTANNGSAATMACTVSPTGSVVSTSSANKSSSSSIISNMSIAPLSPPSTASPPSPSKPAPSPSQANLKTARRKAKRDKKKQKQTCNMPGRMPVGTPEKTPS